MAFYSLNMWSCLSCAGLISCSNLAIHTDSNLVLAGEGIQKSTPRSYACARIDGRIQCDGNLDEADWKKAEWSQEFLDIEGPDKEHPSQKTRFKMLWDQSCLHIAAEMEEVDLWATYDQRDMIVFHENDIEVFLDPDGDSKNYFEIEVNVLGTVFDLFLHRTYREGGPADHGWDAPGMRVGIDVVGSINDPRDRDQSWTLELSIPWDNLVPPPDATTNTTWPLLPKPGDVWRVNFSRVQWDLKITDGKYEKIEGLREHNWTWTPQWEINMHEPRHWGYLEFTDRNDL